MCFQGGGGVLKSLGFEYLPYWVDENVGWA
jgi:hypothetical protein